MKLGIALPTSGPLAGVDNIARIAREADRLGYDSVWTYERVLRPIAPVSMGGGDPQPMPEIYRIAYDPLETLSFAAAITERVTLGTSIVQALLHPAAVLAKRFATLDQLSRGRLLVGLGQGWMPQEFAAAGVPMSRRGRGMDEVVAALRACWGPDPVSFEGEFTHIAESEINPKPAQPYVPILFGSPMPAGIKRAARVADGLNPVAISREFLLQSVETYRTAVKEAGRDPDAMLVVARANSPITPEPLGEDRPFLGGSPRQIAEDLAALEGTGVDHVLLGRQPEGGIDEAVARYAELIDVVRG